MGRLKIPAMVMNRYAEYCIGRAFDSYFVLESEQAHETENPYGVCCSHLCNNEVKQSLAELRLRWAQSSSFQHSLSNVSNTIVSTSLNTVVCWG